MKRSQVMLLGVCAAGLLSFAVLQLLRRPRSLEGETLRLADAVLSKRTREVYAALGKFEQEKLGWTEQKFERYMTQFIYPELAYWKRGSSSVQVSGAGHHAGAFVVMTGPSGLKSEFSVDAYPSPQGAKISLSSLILPIWHLREHRRTNGKSLPATAIVLGADKDGPELTRLGIPGRYTYAATDEHPRGGIASWRYLKEVYQQLASR